MSQREGERERERERTLARSWEMENEENRSEQSPGRASHGGGKVCHRCGWVYPNPHPSKKHRAAHRKHCSAVASKPSDDAADVAGAADVKMAPCEQLSDEDPGNKSGEMVVEELKSEEEERREMGQSRGDGEELCKDAILETDIADNSSESHALHPDNKSQSSDVETTSSQLDDLPHVEYHSVTCGVDKVCTSEDAESSSHSPLTKGSCLDVSKEEMDCATVQNVVDSATVADNTSIGNYVEDRLDLDITKAPILLYDSSGNSSLTDSEIQKIDEYMEFSETADQANAVTTLMSGLPHEVSVSTMEPESFICDAQDEKTDVVGQMSLVQLFCKGGPCTLEINVSENFDTSTHSSGFEYQIGESANSPVNGNEAEDWYTLPVASSTLLVEASKLKPGSLEDSGLVEPDFITICTNAEVGSNLGRHLVDEVAKVVPSKLLAVESDKISNSIPSTLPVNEGFSLDKEKVNAIQTDESNDDHNCRDGNSDRSRLVNEFECEFGVSVIKLEGTQGELDLLKTHEQFASVGSSVDQATDLDGRVTNSCETCSSTTETEAYKVDRLSEGQDTNLSHEGNSAENLRVADSAVTVSGVSQFSATSEISIKSQSVSQEAIQVNNDVVVEEKKHEKVNEESSYMDPKIHSQPEGYTAELELPLGDDIERTELWNKKDLMVSDGVLSSKHEEISSRYFDSISDYHLDQPDVQETLEERFKKPAAVNKIIDHPDRQAEPFVKEAIAEDGLPGEHCDKLDLHKDETDNVDPLYGSQLELQNVFKVTSVDPVSSDKNNPNNPFVTEIDHIPNVEKENSLPYILDKEPNSNNCNEVVLCHDDEGILKIEECPTSKVDVQSFNGKPTSDFDSKTSDAAGVAYSIFHQSSKEEDACDESMQQNDTHIGKIDGSIDSNSRTGSIEALWGSVSDGAIASLRYAAQEESNFDAKSTPPTDSLAIKDPYTSDLAVEGALHKSNVDNNDILEEPSSKPPVEPGRQSVSIENKSVHNSKHEGRNIDEETTARVINWDSGKPHVMLKNLLAEANPESEKKATKGQGHSVSLTSKRSWGLHADGHSLKTATSEIVSDKSNGPFANQADHREWNSPARLPVTKHDKKKVKGRQAWVPFICCPSMN